MIWKLQQQEVCCNRPSGYGISFLTLMSVCISCDFLLNCHANYVLIPAESMVNMKETKSRIFFNSKTHNHKLNSFLYSYRRCYETGF